MEASAPETKNGESLALRREAHKAMSGRVPVVLAIAVALMAGMLIGYGVRAFAVEAEARPPARARRLPCLVVPPATEIGRARIVLLRENRLAEPSGKTASESPPTTR